ncbi:MAG: PAS domain S-box protein [Gammaproteobacteria bacterium]|nr:PAS domain S-box protein [Gammaproteobacteria bacterium]
MTSRVAPASQYEVRFLLWLFPFLVALVLAVLWLRDTSAPLSVILVAAVVMSWLPPVLAARSMHLGLSNLWTYLGFAYGLLGLCAVWYTAQASATGDLVCDLSRWGRVRLTEALLITSGLWLARAPRPAIAWPLALGGSALAASLFPKLFSPELQVLASLATAALLLAVSLHLLRQQSRPVQAGWLVLGAGLQLTSVLLLLMLRPEQAAGWTFATAAMLSAGGYAACVTGLFRAVGLHARGGGTTVSRADARALADLLTYETCSVLLDTQLRIHGANRAFATVVGHECETLPGRFIGEFDLGIDVVTCCRAAERQARTLLISTTSSPGAASPYAWRGSIQPVAGEDGTFEYLLVSLVDTNARQPVLAGCLGEGSRAILEHVSDAIIVCDLNGAIAQVNGAAEKMTGYAQHLLTGMTVFDLHSDVHPRVRAAFHNLRNGIPVRLEFPLLRRDGSCGHVEVAAAPFRAGEQRLVMASLRDITDRKLAEEQLQRSEMRWRAVFDNGGTGIAMISPDGRIMNANAAMSDICCHDGDHLPDLAWEGLFTDAPPLAQIVATGDGYSGRHRLHTGDRQLRWVDLTLSAVRTDAGQVDFFIVMATDVTHTHLAELGRQRHQQELEQANAHKSRFIASASHDLRQPLQAMSILIHLLDERRLDDHNREIITRLREAVGNLGDMVGALLDLTKLDAGLVVPDIAPVSLERVMRVIKEEFGPIAESKGLHLEVETSRVWVRSDRHLLTRIVRNLVANAMRYTNEGEVRVGVRTEGVMVAIEIADTGVGISQTDLPHIFKEFHQGASGRKREGLGLGLAIVEHLARLLDVRIAVDSEVNHGTVFTLWVPLQEQQPPVTAGQPEEPWIPAQKATALVLEDDAEIREGLALLLQCQGYQVVDAGSCTEALQRIEGKVVPSLVVADYRLPDGTGLEVIQAIRERTRGQVAAVILTGEPLDGVRAAIQDTDCELLGKPATTRQLQRAIAAAQQDNVEA